MKGEIVNVQKGMYQVMTENGELLRCLLRGRLLKLERTEKAILSVGDEVLLEVLQKDMGIIKEVLPRRSYLSRKGAGKKGRYLEQVIAANVDQVMIVVSVKDPPYRKNLIERYLTAARSSKLDTLIVFNKSDLGITEEVISDASQFNSEDLTVLFTSTVNNNGIEELGEYLKERSTVLAGSSGVGKSSLINSLLGNNMAEVGEISGSTHKGKHTTTSSRVYYLPQGGKIFDIPGMREFAVSEKDGLEEAFSDIVELSRSCRFNDCSHTVEPGCAVLEAVDKGLLDRRRLRNYVRIKNYE